MIERRPFGRTDHLSSVTLFGAAALARASQADADRALEVLLRYGVNHIDTAARYGDSELRIGPWMARHRKDFFLATKTGSRTAKEGREDIHRSLERLRVDHVDLIQLHSLGHPGRLGSGDGSGRRAGGGDRSPPAGADPVHRRDGSRLDHRGHAPAQPRALRLRFGPASLQLLYGRERTLPAELRRGRRDLPRAQRGRANHQVDRAWSVGDVGQDALHVVPTARGPGRHRPRRPLRGRACPECS